MAYFIDDLGDLLKEMFADLNPKELSRRALDTNLPVEVRLMLVEVIANYSDDPRAQLREIAEKGDGDVATRAAKLLGELSRRVDGKGEGASKT